MKIHSPIKIVITGAESTGKSELAKNLASYYKTIWQPEFAREYIEKLDAKYTYSDIESIAKRQINQLSSKEYFNKYIFFDTGLIITKIWFREVFRSYPKWINEAICNYPVDFYLVCDNDLEWEDDPVRENGDTRDYLMKEYIKEIECSKIPYSIISGKGEERIQNAIQAIKIANL